MENMDEVYEFYNNGAEIDRLERGLGIVEFYRSKEIISQYINGKSVIYDIGGGIGRYSSWLAEQGHDVTMVEYAPTAVDYAKKNMTTPYKAEVGDARDIHLPDDSADVVLLMGPLYHLQNKAERTKALNEAYRVLKPGGLLIATGISKFSSTTWALSVYGNGNDFIDDEIYMNMLRQEILTGEHNRPKEYPYFIANAYFHTPAELKAEIKKCGFKVINAHAVEGSIWISPALNEKWQDPESRNRLLDILRLTEYDETIMGMSPHFLVTARKT